MHDIVLRITGKSDVKTAAMQAKRDLNSTFSMADLVGKGSSQTGGALLLKMFRGSGYTYLYIMAAKKGFEIGKALSDGLSSSEGLIANTWNRIKTHFGGDFFDTKKMKLLGTQQASDRLEEAAHAQDRALTTAAARRATADNTAGAERKATTGVEAAWGTTEAAGGNEIDQARESNLNAEDKLRGEIEDTAAAIRSRKLDVAEETRALEIEKETLVKLQGELVKTADKEKRVIIERDIKTTKTSIEKRGDSVLKNQGEVNIMGAQQWGAVRELAALQKGNDIRMMRLSIEKFISEEQDKQSNAHAVSAGKLKNINDIRNAGLTGYAQFKAAQKGEVDTAEAILKAHREDHSTLTTARGIAEKEGDTGKVEELKKQIAASKALGQVELGNLETLLKIGVVLDKQAQINARRAGLEAKLNMPGGRGEGTPKGLMEGILGIIDPKTGKARNRGIGDLPLQQQMDMLRNPSMERDVKAQLKEQAQNLKREDLQVSEYNKARARGQTEEQLQNMKGAKIAALRDQARPIAATELDLLDMQFTELCKIFVEMRDLNTKMKAPP
ncbi:MAG: hypothetical protein ACOYOU_03355 [Kiritimatiellia bacterium]